MSVPEFGLDDLVKDGHPGRTQVNVTQDIRDFWGSDIRKGTSLESLSLKTDTRDKKCHPFRLGRESSDLGILTTPTETTTIFIFCFRVLLYNFLRKLPLRVSTFFQTTPVFCFFPIGSFLSVLSPQVVPTTTSSYP